MIRKVSVKLKNTHGESLSETMIAGLLIAFGLILAVSMILAGSNMVNKADKQWTAYYQEKHALEGRTTEATKTSGTLTLTDKDLGTGLNTSVIDIYTSKDENGDAVFSAYEKAGN